MIKCDVLEGDVTYAIVLICRLDRAHGNTCAVIDDSIVDGYVLGACIDGVTSIASFDCNGIIKVLDSHTSDLDIFCVNIDCICVERKHGCS